VSGEQQALWPEAQLAAEEPPPGPGSVDARVHQLLAGVTSLHPISVPLLEASGSFLAADAVATGTSDEVVLRAGERVMARQTVRLAAAGVMSVAITPRPRLVVLLPEVERADAHAARSTALLLAAAGHEAGAVVYRAGTAPLDARALRDLVEDQLVRSDLVLVVGDAEGQLEPLQSAVAELGDIQTHRVEMTPGPTHGFGRLGDEGTPLFIVPSDSVAAFTVFEVFVRPLLRTMAADPRPFRRTVRARVDVGWSSPAGVQEFRFGTLGVVKRAYVFSPIPSVDPLAQLSASTAIASIPARTSEVASTSSVLVIPLEDES